MSTNVQNAVQPLVIFQFPVEKINQIPETGLEPFFLNGEKWVAYNGQAIQFHEAPSTVQRTIRDLFMHDVRSKRYFERMNIKGFRAQFEMWYKCVVGGLDNEPDVDRKGKLQPDAYNNLCQEYTCPHRGRLCGTKSNIKREDIEVIRAMAQGLTVAQTADRLCLSVAAVKSRIEKSKQKLHARTAPELIARASQIGINASPRI